MNKREELVKNIREAKNLEDLTRLRWLTAEESYRLHELQNELGGIDREGVLLDEIKDLNELVLGWRANSRPG